MKLLSKAFAGRRDRRGNAGGFYSRRSIRRGRGCAPDRPSYTLSSRNFGAPEAGPASRRCDRRRPGYRISAIAMAADSDRCPVPGAHQNQAQHRIYDHALDGADLPVVSAIHCRAFDLVAADKVFPFPFHGSSPCSSTQSNESPNTADTRLLFRLLVFDDAVIRVLPCAL